MDKDKFLNDICHPAPPTTKEMDAMYEEMQNVPTRGQRRPMEDFDKHNYLIPKGK